MCVSTPQGVGERGLGARLCSLSAPSPSSLALFLFSFESPQSTSCFMNEFCSNWTHIFLVFNGQHWLWVPLCPSAHQNVRLAIPIPQLLTPFTDFFCPRFAANVNLQHNSLGWNLLLVFFFWRIPFCSVSFRPLFALFPFPGGCLNIWECNINQNLMRKKCAKNTVYWIE